MLGILLLLTGATGAQAQCRLCPDAPAPTAARERTRPLSIEVETALDFSRAAGNGQGGSIVVDERSGARRVAGLVDLGGIAIKGSVRLTGEPFGHVQVSLPSSVVLTAPDGSTAEAVDLRADLSPDPALDANGALAFGFGGRLVVHGGASGDFRGRIAIVADYR